MNYTKTLTAIGAIAAIGAALFVGCHDESGNKEKYMKYASEAGATTGYIINASGKLIGPEVKGVITNVLAEITTKLPKETTAETIATDMSKIAADAIAAMHVNPKYAELVNKSVDTLLTLLQTGLTAVKHKHPTEFGNAEIFYSMAYAFFENAYAVVDIDNSARNAEDEVEFIVAEVKFDEIQTMAKVNGKKVNKKTFDEIIGELEKLAQ